MQKNFTLSLDTVSVVKDFVALSNKGILDVSIRSEKYLINGKSIMGIFSLDLSHELSCTVEGSEKDVEAFELGLKELKLI